MNTNNIFENVFEFCCENTVLVLQLTVAEKKNVLDLSYTNASVYYQF